MKIVATIETHMTSSRLLGKVLMGTLGRSMLHYLVYRLKLVSSLDERFSGKVGDDMHYSNKSVFGEIKKDQFVLKKNNNAILQFLTLAKNRISIV
ncbi:hypothetical protein N9K53_01090 [Candidatus Thioglobus sp.]|nr:hypothetical protein [Candidatus Thioglobus sp.]MDA9060379.1 hypothetical protein [Candidatus Thioglobus sp.]